MSIIYQPSGRAREYAEWAANLYRGCPHGCAYCFAPSALRMTKYDFHKGAAPRKLILDKLRKSAEQQPEPRQVHLCFTCDPYPLGHRAVTRECIRILKDAGHSVQILTKGGEGSTFDFDLLDERDEYAATLTLDNPEESRLWEPHAAFPYHRLKALATASRHGLQTWASLEPVIFPEQSITMLMRAIMEGVSKVKVGPLNYKGRLPDWLAKAVPDNIDWAGFHKEVAGICTKFGVEYIPKKDLLALVGEKD